MNDEEAVSMLTAGSGGPIFRTPTHGPELELVHKYIKAHHPVPPRGQRVGVFLEPKIDSGYPDIVFVFWHVATAEQWHDSRKHLTKHDVRVLHYLALQGPTRDEHLDTLYNKKYAQSVERLHTAGLIWRRGRSWQARPLKQIFAVRRIVAIEAKMSEWKQGMNQAMLNTWFASESYLLLPTIPRRTNLLAQAEQMGVGVLTSHHSIGGSVVPARQSTIPTSYASWLFNEWVWMSLI